MLLRSLTGIKRWLAGTSAAVMLAASPTALPTASAQEAPDYKVILQRLETLEKQNQELQKKLDDTQPALQDRAGAIVPAAQDTDAAGFQKRLDE